MIILVRDNRLFWGLLDRGLWTIDYHCCPN